MRVALCISGQPRSVELAFPSIYENIMVPNNPDVYIHSWIDDSIKGKKPITAGGDVACDTIPDDIDSIILKSYNPKKYIFEKQLEFDEKNYNTKRLEYIRPKYSISQKYSIMKSIELALDEHYDAIIRMRFDWNIHKKFDVTTLPLNHLTAPNDAPHLHILPNGMPLRGINDQFAVGDMHVMKCYASIYSQMEHIFNTVDIPFADEFYLSYYMQHMNNIPINTIPIEYNIIRHTNSNNKHFGKDYIH